VLDICGESIADGEKSEKISNSERKGKKFRSYCIGFWFYFTISAISDNNLRATDMILILV
jgi:hypothetical protein